MNNHYYYHNNKIFLHSTFPINKCGLKMLYTHKSRANVFSRDQIHRTNSFNIILAFSLSHTHTLTRWKKLEYQEKKKQTIDGKP